MAAAQLPSSSRRVVGDLKIDLIGQFNMASSNSAVTLTARKDKALLAYLANTPGVPQRRSQLASLLWPQSDDSRARESLKQALLRVRRALPEGLLDTDRDTACLVVDRQHIDLMRTEDLLIDSTYDDVLTVLGSLDRGFLGGLDNISDEFEDWKNSRYHSLRETTRCVMHSVLQQAISKGNFGQAVTLAEKATLFDPLDEEPVRYLIRAYCADGRLRQAQRVLDELKQRLQVELGVEPEPATLKLADSLIDEFTPNAEEVKTPVIRIAVLMFTVGSEESSQRFIAEGLTDDITTDLSRNRFLDVLPASVFSGLEGDLSHVLLARGATHALHGSVRRSDSRLRINTRLVDARTNQIVWAQRYDRPLEDLFDMQDAISSRIVNCLHVELSADTAQVSEHGTRNPLAYKMFHKGRSLYLRGINNHTLTGAKALLDRAITLDPDYARAYAQLAICESSLAMSIVNKTGEDYSEQVLKHARAALDMNPDLALGHAALGLAYYAAGQYQQAENALTNAIELDSNLFEAQFFLARNRRQQGDHEAAIERFRIAAALRPDDFRSSGLLADALKAVGCVKEANDTFKVTLNRIEIELEHHPDNAGALAFGAPILAELNRIEQAREWSAFALAIEPDDCLLRYNQARLFAILGELDVAREHLQRAFDAPLLVRRRLALWMRYDLDFEVFAKKRWFFALLDYGKCTD
ncbi:MAG: BTAD domain-containing putative transcriptional regulator [Granulosicoccus sp.]